MLMRMTVRKVLSILLVLCLAAACAPSVSAAEPVGYLQGMDTGLTYGEHCGAAHLAVIYAIGDALGISSSGQSIDFLL